MPATLDDDAFEPGVFSLSVTRVELKLYRRTKTSADNIQHPPHFEYLVRIDWKPTTQDAEDSDGIEFDSPPSPVEDGWWNKLPRRYLVRRRWADIVRFHSLYRLGPVGTNRNPSGGWVIRIAAHFFLHGKLMHGAFSDFAHGT